MRKMKRLFKARNVLLPWFHWGKIHFILNTISLLASIVTLCFIGYKDFISIWFIACMAQYIPIFIVLVGKYIFETLLYKNVLCIIKRKLSENNIDIKSLNISVDDFSLNSCALYAEKDIPIMDIVNKLNRNFGNGYHIICIEAKSENTK